MEQKENKWTQYYLGQSALMFPNEYVLRMLVGKYPKYALDERNPSAKRILDASCGDGRNLRLLVRLGYEAYATEVSQAICDKVIENLASVGESLGHGRIRPATNENLPFDTSFFDYVLSWNAIYYLNSPQSQIETHVAEYARVIAPGGKLICSVPAPTCYSLQGARRDGNVLTIEPSVNRDWGGGVLNGMMFYSFEEPACIEQVFGSHFTDFRFGSLRNDCFGLDLDYFLFVCTRK